MGHRWKNLAWFLAYAGATCLLVISLAWGGAQEERNVLAKAELVHPAVPQPAITLPAVVVGVHDGDTLTVTLQVRAKIRLLNCWAAELNQPGGKAALEHVKKLTAGKACLVSIPLQGTRTVGDVMTFDRVLAEVWMNGECESVNMQMIRDGFATREKQR